ncbi:hypothetical protein [Anaerococcus sp. AGMB09787]|uniref:hypothetical protein n=1 Tax=Anaerococcus sp. AGMB09787 TaxID=2922869 RepID=UPI001FAF6354|nr:hypothetical protein [Anaerococcus sp. AGMB09787]
MENLKKFTLRDWVLMALALALMVVVGRLLYTISMTLPIPSSRVLVTAPVFAFIYAATAMVTRRIGTVSIISIAYGLYMMRMTIFGALAGVLSGILADIITLVIFRNYKKNRNIVYSVPIRSCISVWTSFFIVKFFVPQSRFIQAGYIPTAIVTVVIYFVGLLVSKYTVEILNKRLGL